MDISWDVKFKIGIINWKSGRDEDWVRLIFQTARKTILHIEQQADIHVVSGLIRSSSLTRQKKVNSCPNKKKKKPSMGKSFHHPQVVHNNLAQDTTSPRHSSLQGPLREKVTTYLIRRFEWISLSTYSTTDTKTKARILLYPHTKLG